LIAFDVLVPLEDDVQPEDEELDLNEYMTDDNSIDTT
tara:strand:- start:161 stop:271 length:111 start_codon:yes stop_codon:yes gene_type:complete